MSVIKLGANQSGSWLTNPAEETSCGWRASLGTLWVTTPSKWRIFVSPLQIMGPWIFAQLEEYHTGVMLYGNGVWGVLEALYSTAGVCFLTAIVSPSYWSEPVFFLPPEWNTSKRPFSDECPSLLYQAPWIWWYCCWVLRAWRRWLDRSGEFWSGKRPTWPER